GPTPPNRKILAGSGACERLSIDADFGVVRPSGDPQEECELRGLGGGEGNFHVAVPWIICFLAHFQADTVLEVPVEFRIVEEVEINAVAAGAVEISGQRGQGAFQIRRAASRVVPLVANFVAT